MMLTLLLVLLVLVVAIALIPPLREWFVEGVKELSDRLVILFLSLTSRFESELTKDGREEQARWREQRLRNIRGLALRSRERYRKHDAHGERS